MKMLRSISRFLLVLVLALGVSCTPGKRITKANVEEVEEGMSKKQVESRYHEKNDLRLPARQRLGDDCFQRRQGAIEREHIVQLDLALSWTRRTRVFPPS
jgi:hypothetical protein